MKRSRYLLLPFFALTLQAGTVDVSTAETVFAAHGATLTFDLSTWSYTAHAQSFGIPLYPSDVIFSLVTAANASGQFAATLSSEDASTSVALDPLGFGSGYFSSSGFQGAVSVLQGHFHLNSSLSQEIFGSGGAPAVV
jgi:hypothetical protein